MADRPEDKIEISAEDLEEVEPPPPPASPRLEITADDLLDLEDEPPRTFPGMPPGAFAPTPSGPFAKEKAGGRTSFSNVGQLCLAGAIGGVIGWMLTEPSFGHRGEEAQSGPLLMEMGLYFGLICLCIGAAFGVVEGLVSRVWQKALTGLALGAGLGLAGGFFGGMAAQQAYSALGGGTGAHGMSVQLLARALGWGLAGCFAGLGQGIAIRSWRKLAYGVLGGLAGGFAGGMLFDPINLLLRGGTGGMSRAVAITIVGAFAGLGIGLVEEIRKQGWVLIMSGLLKGKQFILYREQTSLGSSPKCDIVLPKDAAVQPQHAVIRAEGRRYLVQNIGGTGSVLVNGQPVTARPLRDGDALQIGNTLLAFRAVGKAGTA